MELSEWRSVSLHNLASQLDVAEEAQAQLSQVCVSPSPEFIVLVVFCPKPPISRDFTEAASFASFCPFWQNHVHLHIVFRKTTK